MKQINWWKVLLGLIVLAKIMNFLSMTNEADAVNNTTSPVPALYVLRTTVSYEGNTELVYWKIEGDVATTAASDVVELWNGDYEGMYYSTVKNSADALSGVPWQCTVTFADVTFTIYSYNDDLGTTICDGLRETQKGPSANG